MKTCPVCRQTYSDNETNYCLNDGATLINDEPPPPTVFMNQARTTNQDWSGFETQNQWDRGQMVNNQPFGVQGQAFVVQGQNQTLPIVSLSLGILGIALVCCWGGIPLGAGALITGYIAHNNIKRDSMNYGGSGMAVAGMITGAIGLLIGIIMFFGAILSSLR